MSNEPKHTPGPWRIGDAGNTIFSAYDPNLTAPKRIADLAHTDNRAANIRLIAAAPELLAALKLCDQILSETSDALEALGCERERGLVRSAAIEARAAIAKATGE